MPARASLKCSIAPIKRERPSILDHPSFSGARRSLATPARLPICHSAHQEEDVLRQFYHSYARISLPFLPYGRVPPRFARASRVRRRSPAHEITSSAPAVVAPFQDARCLGTLRLLNAPRNSPRTASGHDDPHDHSLLILNDRAEAFGAIDPPCSPPSWRASPMTTIVPLISRASTVW